MGENLHWLISIEEEAATCSNIATQNVPWSALASFADKTLPTTLRHYSEPCTPQLVCPFINILPGMMPASQPVCRFIRIPAIPILKIQFELCPTPACMLFDQNFSQPNHRNTNLMTPTLVFCPFFEKNQRNQSQKYNFYDPHLSLCALYQKLNQLNPKNSF